MNITFLIGNGFDLRMGMKTRFADMYEGYIAQDSATDTIRKFKEMLEADAPNYITWGDFEMAMAEKAKEFEDEDSFIECLRDFKLYMVSHLEKEQQRFQSRTAVGKDVRGRCIDETTKSIEKFYTGLRPNVVNEFIRLGANSNPEYRFVSFNYTNAFDYVLSPFAGEVIHIHGRLGSDIVLGADNIGQVTDLPYKTTKRFERAFIKPEFNKIYDNSRFKKAKSIIDGSDIICIYGMSLGKSDLSWTKQLKNWLLAHKNNHLVYFVYDEHEFNKSNWDAIIDEEENRIASLLGKICESGDEMSQIFDQVHIPVGYDIFGVDAILKTEKDKADYDEIKREAIRRKTENRPKELGV